MFLLQPFRSNSRQQLDISSNCSDASIPSLTLPQLKALCTSTDQTSSTSTDPSPSLTNTTAATYAAAALYQKETKVWLPNKAKVWVKGTIASNDNGNLTITEDDTAAVSVSNQISCVNYCVC